MHCYLREVELVGIDPSERMLEIARERAGVFGCGVDLRVGDAQALEFCGRVVPHGRFDAAGDARAQPRWIVERAVARRPQA